MFWKRKSQAVEAEFPPARLVAPKLLKSRRASPPPIPRQAECAEGESVAGESAHEEILSHLLDAGRDDRGLHLETALSCVGALAGFAAQMAVRAFAASAEMPPERLFSIAIGSDGRSYYSGMPLRTVLASDEEGEQSVWRLVSAPARVAGLEPAQPGPIFDEVAGTIGTKAFGEPAMSREGRLRELPIDSLKAHWGEVETILERHGTPTTRWSVEIATAARSLIERTKDSLSPDLAARIVMESAVMMSSVDPSQVPGASLFAQSQAHSQAA